MMLRPGTYLQNRYEIIEQIGSGGMSEVYKAKCHILNRMVAIKVLKEEFCHDENFVSKFKMEAQAAAGLSHPNIVNVFDVVNEDHLHYIVMELVEGITLKNYIANKGRLDIREATGIAIQVAQGISAAHSQNIIHRDIKPQNMILGKDGKVKVTDFGIARAVSAQTLSSSAMGSVHYISPEQAKGEFTDERSDIYSLGITIYEMVTGRLPFEGETTVAVALAHLEEEMVPPTVYNPLIPSSLEQIILKCTNKDPSKRYQNIQNVISDLKKSLVSPNENPVVKSASPELDIPLGGNTRIIDQEQVKLLHESGINRSSARSDRSREESGPGMDNVMTFIGVAVAIIIVIVLLILFLKIGGFFPGKAETEASESQTTTTAEETTTINEKEVKAPALLGLTQDEAEDILKENNLQIQIMGSEYSDQYEIGQIMAQVPDEGEIISKYSKVQVTVSLGSNKIDLTPLALTTLTGTDAKKLLEDQGLVVTLTEDFDDTVEKGKVISYEPAEPLKGSTITLHVSKGKEIIQVQVPDVKGKTEQEAQSILTGAGFTIASNPKRVNSNDVAAGLIITQSPEAGTNADTGAQITYEISLGPEVETTTQEETLKYKYIASIDTTYNLSDLIGPGSSQTSVQIMIRLKQTVGGNTSYTTLMDARTVTGDTILPVRFKSIEGAYGVEKGEVQVVDVTNNTVLKGYDVEFFKVQ